MDASPAQPPPSPALFFDTMNAYQRSAALKAAIELELFTTIGEGATTVEAIAGKLGAPTRGVRILADYLVVIGFLTKAEGIYGLTPDTALFLDGRSPAYAGGAVAFLGSPALTRGFDRLAEIVRAGGLPVASSTIGPENPVWVEFARGMAPLARLTAQRVADIAGPGRGRKILDIAAGHGLFGLSISQRDPEAEIVAVDWPAVLAVAEENARALGLGDRFRALPGSAFDVDFGKGHDLALVPNFLHHFDESTCVTLLRKVRAALSEGGRTICVEFVPNEDRVSPPVPAAFALAMLGSTPAGDAYTAQELIGMYNEAGYQDIEVVPLAPTPHHAVVGRR